MRELRVRVRFAAADVRDVGTLVEDGRRVWFQYDDAFVARGPELSPLRLPLRTGLVEHRVTPGAPIPGVFNDARPDGWGLKLLHRAFQQRGRAPSSVSPLEELAFLGSHTMGALVFEPSTGPGGDLHDAVELAALAAHAQTVWDDRAQEVLPELDRRGALDDRRRGREGRRAGRPPRARRAGGDQGGRGSARARRGGGRDRRRPAAPPRRGVRRAGVARGGRGGGPGGGAARRLTGWFTTSSAPVLAVGAAVGSAGSSRRASRSGGRAGEPAVRPDLQDGRRKVTGSARRAPRWVDRPTLRRAAPPPRTS